MKGERNYNHRDFKTDLLPPLNTWTDNFTNLEKVKKQYARSKVDIHMALRNMEPKIFTHSDSPRDKSYLSLIFNNMLATYLVAVIDYLTKSLKNVRVSLPCGLRVVGKVNSEA